MASITITEIDNTSIGSQPLLTNAVYVPGFSINGGGASAPKLYTSIYDFEEELGGEVI